MSSIVYKIIEHDGGWAYTAEGTVSETFPSHDAARAAARHAARDQAQPGESAGITWEDSSGRWHEELADGEDRPNAEVEG